MYSNYVGIRVHVKAPNYITAGHEEDSGEVFICWRKNDMLCMYLVAVKEVDKHSPK